MTEFVHVYNEGGGIRNVSAGAGPTAIASNANLAAALAETGANYFTESIWQPPVQPTFRDSSFFSGWSATAESIISELWEPIRAANPSYCTRALLGPDSSGLYNVWKYVFTPERYDRTIVLIGAVHGLELTGSFCLYLLMKQVIEQYTTHANLAFLRQNCRIVIIPVANPWGVNQATRQRNNSNDVDINRNADYRWGNFTEVPPYNKGSAPWSELESQYIRDTILAYPDITAFVDCHNTTNPSGYQLYAFASAHEGVPMRIGRRVIDGIQMLSPSSDGLISSIDTPQIQCWAAKNGINAMTLEWNDGVSGNNMWTAADMTLALRWKGNMIMQLAAAQTAKHVSKLSPRSWVLVWRTGVDSWTFASATYAEVLAMQKTLDINASGILTVSGSITISSASAAEIAYVTPRLSQPNTEFFVGSTPNADWEKYGKVVDSADRVSIPFTASIPVFQTDNPASYPVVGLYVKTGAGQTIIVQRYTMNVVFTPTDASARCEHYSATGNLAAGVNAMVRKFPTVAT